MTRKFLKWISRALAIMLALFICVYLLQNVWAHRNEEFVPDYEMVELTEQSDYKIIMEQTGLGRPAIEKLMNAGEIGIIREIQALFFASKKVECDSVFGWFTRSDQIEKKLSPPMVDLQPGDILITFSTHSIGWRHGHAGLVLDENHILECTTLGKRSSIVSVNEWKGYSNYTVLRVFSASQKEKEEVVAYAKENLCDRPYHLSAGFIGDKAPLTEESYFGLQCAYLVWYSWQHFGYDLDSDGGRLVTARDLLESKLLQMVQVYGMDPRTFE